MKELIELTDIELLEKCRSVAREISEILDEMKLEVLAEDVQAKRSAMLLMVACNVLGAKDALESYQRFFG
ncbi:MAG: hypothetical protein ACE5HW_05880 [Candidatus Methanofastidiosia archaeon]